MRWSPFVTVAAVIRDGDLYLMVEECPDGRSVLNQPAGHLEFGETLLEAVRREVREETARAFHPTGLVGVYQWALPDSEHSYLRFCFCGTVGDPLPDARIDPAIRAVHWLTLEQIGSGDCPTRSPMVLHCIRDAAARPPLALEVLHALA